MSQCRAEANSPRIRRTARQDRLIFNTWRRPFPYLLHRWDIVIDQGWLAGFILRRKAEQWMAEYNALGEGE